MKTRIALVVALAVALLAAGLLWLHPWRRSPAGGADRAGGAQVAGGGVGAGAGGGAAAARGDGGAGGAQAAGGAKGRTVLAGKWGSGPGQFGRKEGKESAPEAPMSFLVGKNGEILILDQVNGRVQRFRADGTVAGEVNVGADTVQDLTVDANGNLLVLDRLADSEITVYGPDGQPRDRIPVVGGPITEGGSVTGMFTDPSGTYLEREHTETIRVAGPDGKADSDRPAEPGRPSRDGNYYLWAAIADPLAGIVSVRVFDRDARLLWGRQAAFPHGIVHLLLLDSDLRGYLYLGALVGDEQGDQLINLATVVLRFRLADGTDAGSLVLPANNSPDEVYRELVVGDDGAIYQILPSDDGVTITRYDFP